jgi:hypothetical protein
LSKLLADEVFWREEFAIIDGRLSLWNLNVIPFMGQRGEEYKKFAHAEAKRLGWRYNKALHAYEAALTDEEYAVTMSELARQELRRWLKGRRTGMVPTHVKGVLACWDISQVNDTGLLILRDRRTGTMIQKAWNDVPRELYDRLFTRQAGTALAQILTIFAGQELDGLDVMRLIHDRETDIAHVG